jgi:hypothetical protein
MVMNRALSTLDHFPSINQIAEICEYLQSNKSLGHSKKPVVNCVTCGGRGYLVCVNPEDQSRMYAACDDCEAGKYESQRTAKFSDGTYGRLTPSQRVARSMGFTDMRKLL